MPLVDVDVSKAGVIDSGTYLVTVSNVKYQLKTGEKWNKEGTSEVDFPTWSKAPDVDGEDKATKRLSYEMTLEDGRKVFTEFYTKKSALGFLKDFLKACGCDVKQPSFDTDEPLNKQINLTLAVEEDSEGNYRNKITKYGKV